MLKCKVLIESSLGGSDTWEDFRFSMYAVICYNSTEVEDTPCTQILLSNGISLIIDVPFAKFDAEFDARNINKL
jgi:hypothetical protein